MKQKMMLINPPGRVYIFPDGRPSSRKHCTPPLGLAYLAAVLRENKIDVCVVDMTAEGLDNETRKDDFLVYGMPTDELLRRIEIEKPTVIGISILFSFLFSDVVEICKEIKKRFDIPIVVGGHHPTAMPNLTLSTQEIDYAIVAEAEVSIVYFMRAMRGEISIKEVPNLYYKENGEVFNTLDFSKAKVKGSDWGWFHPRDANIQIKLDELPKPAWDLFPMEKYWDSGTRIGGGDVVRYRYAVMLASRGCPHVCFFCPSGLTSGYKGYRIRSLDSVLDEIRWLKEVYKVEEIQFLDDNLFASKSNLKLLLNALIENFKGITFSSVGGTEINKLDDEIIDLLQKANFSKVLLSVEAGDQDVQNSLIDKKVKLNRLPELLKKLKEKGIERRGQFMIGFPGETKEQIMKTIQLVRELDFDDFMISIATPMPGTPFYDQCVREDLFVDDYDLTDVRFAASKVKLPDVTPQELESIRRKVWEEEFPKRRENFQIRKYGESFDDEFDFSKYENVGFKLISKEKKE